MYIRSALSVVLVVLSSTSFLPAQQPSPARVPGERRVDLKEVPSTQTERLPEQAQETISLPVTTILELLRKEPGLGYVVKRRLVRLAYQQGRLLEASEINDEALQRLVAEDALIRSIVSEEIFERGYLQVRKTKEERLRDEVESIQLEDELGRLARASGNAAQDASPAPGPGRTRRAGSAKLGLDDLRNDSETLERISPDQLPSLLRAGGLGGSASRIGGSQQAAALAAISATGGSDSRVEEIARSFGQTGSASRVPERTTVPSAADAATVNSLRRESRLLADRGREPYPGAAFGDDAARPTEGVALNQRVNPYANVPSLFDIYTQVSPTQAPLERFGARIFEESDALLDQVPMDLPVGPDYVVGPGDGLTIDLWGPVSQRYQRYVDRQGRVALPEAGTVLIAGKTLAQAQEQVQQLLQTIFRDVEADVSLSRLRTIRVYVVGDVANPGAYDVSSLSTPLNAIYSAGGPTSRGSLRIARHMRGNALVQEIDLYDLLLRGVRAGLERLESGDTIAVPPIGKTITVDGMVRRPAIYELKDEKSLNEALALAGGVLPTGTLRSIAIERVKAHEGRSMVNLDLPETDEAASVRQMEQFNIADGDKIRIQPILPYAQKTVYLDGHVFQPGKYPYQEGMRISDLIKSYKNLLPEPSKLHAEVIRLSEPDFKPVVLSFNLEKALAKDASVDLPLQPFDTVRVFGRYDFEDPPFVTIAGEVRNPGRHQSNGQMRVRDAVYLAGGLTLDAQTQDAQVIRKVNGRTKVLSINLAKALAGDAAENLALESQDQLIIHRNLARLDPPSVAVGGEVAKPGRYPLGEGMSVADLVKVAGGLKRSAFAESASLTRLSFGSKTTESEQMEVQLSRAIEGDPEANLLLHDGDTLSVRQITGFNDLGAAVTVRGEVRLPSTYGIKPGERLSALIARAGGFAPDAFPEGIVLERAQVRAIEEQQREELVRRLEQEQANFKLGIQTSPGEAGAIRQSFLTQQGNILSKLKTEPVSGRLVVRISSNLKRWENTPADVELRAGDRITVPKRPTFVTVTGQVYNPTAITYTPGKTAAWYLRQAGGLTELGNKKNVYIIRASGQVIGRDTSGWWSDSAMNERVGPGDAVVVPEKVLGGTPIFRTLLESAQVVSSLALSAAVALR